MKKIFLKIIVLFIVLLFNYNNTFSSDCSSSCTIKDWTAEILNNYFANNKKIISNISKQLTKKEKKPWYYLQKENIKIHNLIFNWNDTLTTWEFFTSQISWEIPQPIQRDLRRIKRESENINRFLKSSLERWYWNNIIKNVCKWVDYCNFWNNLKASDIIWQLVANNAKITDLYKLNILWKKMSFSGKWQIILVPKNFESEMHNFYNQYSIYDCSQCDWAFADRITKSWKKFLLNTKNWERWIEEWQEAWDLLRNSHSNTKEIQKLEAKLLKEELSNQWVTSSNADAILKNLDDFNNNWYSSGNDPISNTFNTMVNFLDISWMKRTFSDFWETVMNVYNKQTDTTQINIRTFSNVKEDIWKSYKIMSEINLLYQKQIPFISTHNLNSEKLRNKIIKMHQSITNSINILDKQIPKAIKICNQQGKWQGKCSY